MQEQIIIHATPYLNTSKMAHHVLSVAVILAVCSFCMAAPQDYSNQRGSALGSSDSGREPFSPAVYSFNYEAQDPSTGNSFTHGEQRDGQATIGTYRVALPDGRTQVVRYSVEGNSGYRSEVSYE